MLIVDAMNVIGTRADGWWRDRVGAVERLVARLEALHEPLLVVVDGRPTARVPEGAHGPVEVVYAPGGPNAADRRIVEIVRESAEPASATVITSDRDLARRVRALGAVVVGSGTFLERLDRARPEGA
ncbi:MAG: NYN domain-containing protein [Actinomycetota bacterium]|nr:NYN domain-containing protein [Actinomycetota bacterium]